MDEQQSIRISLDGWEPGTSLLDFLILKNRAFSFYSGGGNSGNYIEFRNVYCKRDHEVIDDNAYSRPNSKRKECRKCRELRRKPV
jgi:hypothetical protein